LIPTIKFLAVTVTSTKATLMEETFAVQPNREFFIFCGNKLSPLNNLKNFHGNKLSRLNDKLS